jgi:hypothetical protein
MTAIAFTRHANLQSAQAGYRRWIDEKAGEVRQRFARDWLIDEEYWLAAQQAQTFADGGYSGDAPDAVQSWADASNRTPQQAADNILATRATYNAALEQVRRIRLTAKQSVMQASTVRDAFDVAEAAVATLDAITPPA